MAQSELENVWSGWIIPSPEFLEERERKNIDWLRGSPKPEQMSENFVARNLCYNDLIKEKAYKFQMNILLQTGDATVDDLCNILLRTINGLHSRT